MTNPNLRKLCIWVREHPSLIDKIVAVCAAPRFRGKYALDLLGTTIAFSAGFHETFFSKEEQTAIGRSVADTRNAQCRGIFLDYP
jgi:hypothetical protein